MVNKLDVMVNKLVTKMSLYFITSILINYHLLSPQDSA